MSLLFPYQSMFENDFQWDFRHVGTSKLICDANRWTGSCVMRFLPKGRSEYTMILHLCGGRKYTTVLCFSIREVIPGSLPHSHVQYGGFPVTVPDKLGHHRLGVLFF